MPTIKLNRHEFYIDYLDPDSIKIWFDLIPGIKVLLNFADMGINKVGTVDAVVFDTQDNEICTFNCDISYRGDLSLTWSE